MAEESKDDEIQTEVLTKVLNNKGWEKMGLSRELGSGTFGRIYHGKNMKTNEEVALKMEPVNKKKRSHPRLLYEREIYRLLEGGGK